MSFRPVIRPASLYPTLFVGLMALAGVARADKGEVTFAFPMDSIVVDGQLDEWPEEMARYPLQFLEEGDPLNGEEDFVGEFRVGYNSAENSLYVAVEVQDDSVVRGQVGRGSYNTQDGCEVYVAFGQGATPIQYFIRGPNQGVYGPGRTEDAQVQALWREDGYQFEWKIDLTLASKNQFQLRPPALLRFDVSFWDRDEDESASWIAWTRGKGKYLYSERMGHLVPMTEGMTPGEMLSLSSRIFEDVVNRRQRDAQLATGYQMFFTGVLLAFTLLHMLLFLFDPKSKVNLFYALYTGMIAVFIFSGFQLEFSPDISPELVELTQDLAIVVVGVFGLRFLYAFFYPVLPRHFRYLLLWMGLSGLAIGLKIGGVEGFIVPTGLLDFLVKVLYWWMLVETGRVIVSSILEAKEGSRIVGIGFAIFAFNISPLISQGKIDASLLYWVLLPLISMSVYLARTIARANKSLANQLVQVRSLSEKTQNSNRELQQKTRQLEKANQEVLRANQAKSAFLANMSHEIRTPMNAIVNFSALIQDGLYGEVEGDMKDAVDEISRNSENLLALINDILDLSKIEAGAMGLNIGSCDPGVCVENAVARLEYEAEGKGLELKRNIEADLPLVQADERRITQHVLANLIKNAIKFTGEGQIEVGASKQAEDVAFYVKDTGIGIAPEEQERIFEPFHQVDSSDSRLAGGTGLGLAVARRFVEMHKGRLWVESTLGAGTIFYFTLPIKAS